MLALLHTQLPGGGLGRGRCFFGLGLEGIPLLLQLLDPRHQRGGLLLSCGHLGLKVSAAKLKVFHLRAPCRQTIIDLSKKVPLPPELLPDVPLPPQENRFPKGPVLELLNKQKQASNTAREARAENDAARKRKPTYSNDTG